ERSALDGMAVASFADAVLGQTPEEHSTQSGARPQGTPELEPVEFVLDEQLEADARDAAVSFAAHAAGTATSVLSIDGFGSDQLKRLRVSPDAFIQMAFQLAHRRTRGVIGTTCEAIATRQYRRGRTEAMRVVTPEVVAFVELMQDPDADDAARRAA